MNKTAVKIILYIKPLCPYCVRAKALLEGKSLEQKGIQYEEVNVGENPELFDEVKSLYDVKTVPQIFIIYDNGNVTHINGCNELVRFNKEGKLDEMLYTTSYIDNESSGDSNSNDNHYEGSDNSSKVDCAEFNVPDTGIEIV